jgi:hypothetical protein
MEIADINSVEISGMRTDLTAEIKQKTKERRQAN